MDHKNEKDRAKSVAFFYSAGALEGLLLPSNVHPSNVHVVRDVRRRAFGVPLSFVAVLQPFEYFPQQLSVDCVIGLDKVNEQYTSVVVMFLEGL